VRRRVSVPLPFCAGHATPTPVVTIDDAAYLAVMAHHVTGSPVR
jgi:hypothetical protein